MSTTRSSTTHIERTAKEPRDTSLHTVILSHIDSINSQIRLLRLSIPKGNPVVKFLPGQWLDVHIPGLPKPGGFTITSTPREAVPDESQKAGYLELAIQNQPLNPAAAWLWCPETEILEQELNVRVGGGFVWPPPNIDIDFIKRVVFVAGGVGINPLVSIASHLAQQRGLPFSVKFIYTLRDLGLERNGDKILFLRRLRDIFMVGKTIKGDLELYLTPSKEGEQALRDGEDSIWDVPCKNRRVTKEDVIEALGPVQERSGTVCYICGVPTMTDEFVEVAQKAEGMDSKKVLFERWW